GVDGRRRGRCRGHTPVRRRSLGGCPVACGSGCCAVLGATGCLRRVRDGVRHEGTECGGVELAARCGAGSATEQYRNDEGTDRDDRENDRQRIHRYLPPYGTPPVWR